MAFDPSQLIPLLPEIILVCGASSVLLADLAGRDKELAWPYLLALLTLIAAAAFTLITGSSTHTVLFDGTYVHDSMSDLLKVSLLILAIPVLVYAREGLRKRNEWRGEFLTLMLFSILGMQVVISSNGFIPLYLGLELLSLCLYALVAFQRGSATGAEAAMKYFVLGVLASGLLLYGMSMLYGVTGRLDFPGIAAALRDVGEQRVLIFGLVFLVIGIAFKFGAVPFHMWVPDVYDGAPTPVTLLVGSLPKIAAIALAMRLLVDGLENLLSSWQSMLMILAVLSMVLGNLAAIAQQNIKRMLAFSTVSHVGFIFLGILSGTEQGYQAAIFYTIVYVMMSAGAFGVLIALDRKDVEVNQLYQLKGLHERHPLIAATMLLVMFSMAGVPPTVGFFAKLFVLEAVLDIGLVWLAIVAIVFSIVGAFYYLRVIKHMYFDKPIDTHPLLIGNATEAMLILNGVAVLIFGLFPTLLIQYL